MATIVTAKGREIIVNQLRATGTEPKVLSWGLNPLGLTSATTDVAPFDESAEARVTGTSSVVTTTTTNDTFQVVGTITATGARAITEAFLSDSTTKPAAAAVAAGGVVGSAVATTLNTAATFTPGNGSDIQIRTEVMNVTAGSGSTALTVVRGQNGSSAISSIIATDVVQPGNAPNQTAVTGGSVFAKGDFAVVNLNTSDSIAFTWQIKFT